MNKSLMKHQKERKYKHEAAKAHAKGKPFTFNVKPPKENQDASTNHFNLKKPVSTKDVKVFIVTEVQGQEVVKPHKFKNEEFLSKLIRYARHILINHGVLLPRGFNFEVDFRPQIDSLDSRPSALIDVHVKVKSNITHTLHDILVYLDADAIIEHGVISIQPKKLIDNDAEVD